MHKTLIIETAHGEGQASDRGVRILDSEGTFFREPAPETPHVFLKMRILQLQGGLALKMHGSDLHGVSLL